MRGATECSHCVRSQKLVELACSSPSSSKWHQDHGINLSPLTNTSIPSMEYPKVVEYNVRQKNESARLNAFQADKIIPEVPKSKGGSSSVVFQITVFTMPLHDDTKLKTRWGADTTARFSTSLDIMLSYFIFADEKLVFYAFLRNTNVGTV